MAAASRNRWVFIQLIIFLTGGLADSSSLPPSALPESVTSRVGNQVVLPCSWKSHLQAAPLTYHVQWINAVDTVFELRGHKRYQGEEFSERVEVREERLAIGDCSLIIDDVQIGDAGHYESFMVVDGAHREKTRVFIHSIRLLVFDHKVHQRRAPGEDFELDLYTRHSERVIFLGRNSSQWSHLWMREEDASERLEKDPLKEQLKIRKVTEDDQGTYKVLDKHGLAISTVQLSVREKQVGETPLITGYAARSRGSALLGRFLLATGFPTLLLLLLL